MSYKWFRNLYLSGGALFVILTAVLGALLYANGKIFLMPGPLSAVAMKGEPLEGFGSHAEFEQSCGHCHAPVHCITDTRCQDCHMDVAQQRTEGEGLHARIPGTSRCQTCHIEHQGREIPLTDFAFANIDHATLAGFSLDQHQLDYEGNHMGCESCHSQSRFAGDTLDCISCHVQDDHDAMAGHIETYGATCVPCHDGLDTMATFVHEDVYPLDGGHVDTECLACHEDQTFAGTPSDCKTCHEKTSPFANMFGTACERCHTTVAWAPALLTQHTFSLTHGGEELLECESCHVGEYQSKSCYECHEDHQEAEMVAAHLEVEVFVLDRCEECHPTGAEGEAERLRAEWQPLREVEAAWIEAARQYLLGISAGSSGFTAPAEEEEASTQSVEGSLSTAAESDRESSTVQETRTNSIDITSSASTAASSLLEPVASDLLSNQKGETLLSGEARGASQSTTSGGQDAQHLPH